MMTEQTGPGWQDAAGRQVQKNSIKGTQTKICRAELLAPAGNYDCFLAAVHAGADAVYLAGKKFGARAAADNFNESELISAIRYAHLFGRRVYLTVNTLLKDDELDGLAAYLRPYVDAGLDAVIVQDFGVLSVIRREFPALAVHCSTQMTITDEWGVRLAMELGASRVVPARELTLSEIKGMKEACPDMELECFIHGAMCYSYSGQCLMSSMIGGRSGNRGSCAQPCRLPYDVELPEASSYLKQSKQSGMMGDCQRSGTVFREAYPLSLKDLCAVRLIPELIDAGIDSFKIEGRMKNPEYCAGVTAVYRAVMDRCFKTGKAAQGVTDEELALLRGLYVRSEIGEGYYCSQIGRQMLTQDKPGYRGCEESVLTALRERYLERSPVLYAAMELELKIGTKARLTVRCGPVEVTCTGDIVQAAEKKPMAEEELKRRLAKTGGTPFLVKEIQILMKEPVFLPVGRLNELRREALSRMEEALLAHYDEEQSKERRHVFVQKEHPVQPSENRRGNLAGVLTQEQFAACTAHPFVQGICAPVEVYEACWRKQGGRHTEKTYYLSLPRILRRQDIQRLEGKIRVLAEEGAPVRGIYVHTAGEYRYAVSLSEIFGKRPQEFLFGSPFLYCMNTETVRFWQNRMCALSLPYELSEHEIYALLRRTGQAGVSGLEMPVYGHIPMMITANCIMRSFDRKNCPNTGEQIRLKDRTGKRMYVRTECGHCLNTIYNSVPLSMHKHMQKLQKLYDEGVLGALMWNFTVEGAEQTTKVLDRYLNADTDAWTPGTYTNGHFQRGVV